MVLDDDPTGIQTVHDCDLLTRWDQELIEEAFRDAQPLFFILTNSRAHQRARVRHIVSEAVCNVIRVNRSFGYRLFFVSRSDSTLRSHFPLETNAIAQTLLQETGQRLDAVFLCPAFFEAQRITSGDTHYIREKGRNIPTSSTEFARDSVFGYSSSHLPSYIKEKTGGLIRKDQVRSLTLDLLRDPDAAKLEEFIQGLHDMCHVVVNAEEYRDLSRFAGAVLAATGKHFIFQCAASLVKALSRIPDKPPLGAEIRKLPGPGIVIVGSHVGKATEQLESLKNHPAVEPIEVNLASVLVGGVDEMKRLTSFARACERRATTPVVYTPRRELTFESKDKRLKVGLKISSFLARLIRELPYRPSFVIAKGGITSHAVMVEGLRVKKARVLGQILPGIAVIAVEGGHKAQPIPLVIVPGNVGNNQALHHILTVLGE